MASRQVLVILAGVAALTGSGAAAQESPLRPRTPNTLTAPAEFPSPKASVQDMAWFAGSWDGDGLGGVTEEHWSEPAGGAMMGMFRLLKDGKPVFYEFLTLVEHEGSLLLKLKHFNPDMTGWEEKADSIRFRLLRAAPGEMAFDGITFRRSGLDTVKIFLAIRNRSDGAVREEVFTMTRRAR